MKDMRLWCLRQMLKANLDKVLTEDFQKQSEHMKQAILTGITNEIVDTVKMNFCDMDAEEPGR